MLHRMAIQSGHRDQNKFSKTKWLQTTIKSACVQMSKAAPFWKVKLISTCDFVGN